jgi:hypothetical protein
MHQRRPDGLLNLGHNLRNRPRVDVLDRVALRLPHPLGRGDPLAVHLFAGRHQHDWDGPFCRRLVEALAERLGEAVDDPVVGKEDIVFAEELALRLVRLELGPDVANVDDPADLGPEVLGKVVRDRVLVPALGVRRY